jgi:hypothetical protein
MRSLMVTIAAVTILATASSARAQADAYDDSQSHPLRIAAYLLHPIGYTLEWLVTRPFHELVAQPDLEPLTGHEPHGYYGDSPLGMSTGAVTVRRDRRWREY